MSAPGSALFDLLPALYRIRDGSLADRQTLLTASELAELAALQAVPAPLTADEQARLDELTAKAGRGPLESLLMLVEEQLAAISENLDQLYDDQFIETCAPWVIPYIGDLIGFQSVHGIAPAIANSRAEVANTISFRRRKGTLLVMEQLARDTTGWPSHAVEFFQVLGDTQFMNHLRPGNHYTPDLRNWKSGLYVDHAFDRTSHRVDVRRIATKLGRYNIQNIGIFVWSLCAYGITRAPASPAAGQINGYRFDALGCDISLFNDPVTQGDEIMVTSQAVNVPDRLRRRVLCDDLRRGAGATYYGEGNSLAVYVNGALLTPFQIQTCNLSGADGSWANTPVPSTFMAAIDPELGRIALSSSAGASPAVELSYHYGFNADMGGGEYPRESTFAVRDPAWVLPYPDTASPPRYTTLQGALDFAVLQLNQTSEIAVEVSTSGSYTAPGLKVDLPKGATVELRAADSSRPVLVLSGEIEVTGADLSGFCLNGFLISSDQTPASGTSALVHAPMTSPGGENSLLDSLKLIHCTLCPGWSVTAAGDPVQPGQPVLIAETAGLTVTVQRAILGPILADEPVTVDVSDSVIDSNSRSDVAFAALDGVGGGGTLTLDGCTVVGKVHATLLSLVSNSIIWSGLASGDVFRSGLWSDRKQAGCVRFSYIPTGSITPRRFECVEQGPGVAQPLFYSLRFGDPAYAKLLPSTDDTIRRGAHDAAEMGVFHFVQAPLREADLGVRMREYLPVGLEYAVFYEN